MADSSSLKILVIDDEAAFADSLTKLLRRKFKAHVESVGCADAAREKMAEDFDIITLDYQMPDCDGLSLLQEISALPGAPPVIMVTGHGDEQVATEAFRLGVSGYVLKDQRMPDMLHDAIHKALIGRELLETRKQLSFQEREYKDLVESSNSIILREDVDGNITYMNKYGLDFFGYDADELVGHNIRGTIVEDVDSEGRDLAGMVDDKLADPDRFIVNENENIKKNGERVWIAWSNRSLFDADGNRIGHIAIGNDVTVRRKNEKALRQQADILDSVSEAVMVQDASGGQHTPILYWNGAAERLTGYSKEEAIGTSSFDLLKPEYDGSREDLRHTVIEEGKASYSGSLQRKDGSRIPVEVNIRATYDPDGKPSKTIAIVRDITEMKKAEESLRETTEYLENLFGYANAPIIVWEPSLKITRFNRAFERMTGYEAEEVIGKELGMLFPETTREESLRKIGLTSEGEQWESVEIPILRRDGDVRIALWNSANVYAADGTTMLATIARGQDITERKHMEERLKESEVRFRTVADFTYDWETWDAPDGTYLYVSPSCERITGYRPEEFIDDPELMVRITHPDDRDALAAHYEEVRCCDLPLNIELRIIDRQGREHWIGHWCHQVRNAEGTLLGRRASNREITEMKKAEESLRETTEYLENLFGYANAPIIVWEPSLKITRFNRAFERMTGYEAEEVIGKELGMLFPETTREESLRKIGLTSEGEQWESVEIPILRRDGDVRIALWNSANVYAADGTTMLATIAQGQDITERKHMEERLKRLNDELDGYAHMVSHDLKSPLSAIDIANAMLREDIANIRDEQVRHEVADGVEAIGRSLIKTYELVNGLLSLAEAGQAPVETEHVSVFKIVSEILEERSAQIAEKHSHVQIEGDLGVIEGNALQIYQVFNNLIGNALVHNDANEPRIIIRSCVTDDSGAHRYEVCDNGSGIPSEEVEAVFKPFYKRGSGSENGIGLSIVKKVVELYGGSIRIVNRDGACFDFTLRDWEPGALLKEPPGSVGPAKIKD